MIHKFDTRRKIALLDDMQAMIKFSADHFIKCASEAIKDHNNFFVALSGGSTPKDIFGYLAKHHKTSIEWNKVNLFWSDERSVALDNPESNYHMAMNSGLETLPITYIHPMRADTDIKKGAKDYEALIKKEVPSEQFDLIMLGMGDDGHTASLFPETIALTVNDRLVIENEVKQKKTMRMTFTYSLINQAKNIVIYVKGSNKNTITAKALFDHKNNYPISKIGTERSNALWIIDADAASNLNFSWNPT